VRLRRGGIFAGKESFRLRQVGDIALLVLQLLLFLWGVALIVVSLVEYNVPAEMQQGLSVSGLDSAVNSPPTQLRLIQQGTIGLVAIGLSVGLLYLRRRYQARRQ
jgi:hypothetical protein